MTNAFEIKNISKEFHLPHRKINTLKEGFLGLLKGNTIETFKVIENLSFNVAKGECFGVIGKNGSGKSTLLKLLAKIYEPTRGEIIINGCIAPFLELGVGFNPDLTGRENIYLNGLLLGMTKKEIEGKFAEIVEFSELERFLDQKLKNYSSGMQMRLAFAVAIQSNMDILLLDEVLAVGDMNFQKKCLEKMNEFKKSGKTIIYVSHDLNTVKSFCDRILYLKNSSEYYLGAPEEMVDMYTIPQ